MNEVIPKTIDKLVEEIKTKDPETAEKIKKLRVEVIQLKEDLIKVYEEIKKPLLQHFNELKEDVITKTKPIVKRWTPIVKDIEVSVTDFCDAFFMIINIPALNINY